MKGTMTWGELADMAKLMIEYHKKARLLLGQIQSKTAISLLKLAVDQWFTDKL